MKAINRLLRKASELYDKIMTAIYDYNEDDFIQALGLDPKDYEVLLENNEVAYDFEIVDLLSEGVLDIWADYENVDTISEVVQEVSDE